MMNAARLSCLMLVTLATVTTAPASTPDTTRTLDPEAARRFVDLAREAAGRDRHEEAAHIYLDALACDARLVPTVADELAYQKLWREDAEKAIFYFRRYMARHPDRPNREVRQGLALAYSWNGRQGDAIRLYRELVAEDPSDDGSRLGLGRSLIWDNRLHEGARVLYTLEADPEASAAGRRGATRFLLTVLDEYDPTLDLRWAGSWDSDDLSIQRLSGKARTHLGSVLVEVRAGHAWYAQPERPSIRAPRLGGGLVAPLAHDWTLHAYAWLDRFQGDRSDASSVATLDWNFPGADAWLTWIATNRLRLDLGAGRQALESLDALAKELHLDQVNLSADWRVTRHWTLSGLTQLGALSDDNERRRANARVIWHREGTVDVRLGPTVTYMDHTLPYPGGYWAPDWVRNVGLETRIVYRRDHWVLRLDGGVSRETEQGSDAITVGAIAGHVGWRLDSRWLVGLDGSHSRSRFASASGYRRTAVGVSARALF